MPGKLTIVMPFYLNRGMLGLQYMNWAAWPDPLKASVSVILVDDGSPDAAADVERPDGLPEISIYRLIEDKPWHQHAARNLGAHFAPEGWMLLTDMDHVLTAENCLSLLGKLRKLDSTAIYMLNRVEADTGLQTSQNGRPKPHPNSFVVTRETFWKIGGYDEEFCGIYGTDALFRTRAAAKSKLLHLSDVSLTRYWRELVPDASTSTLPRKEGRDPGAKERIIAAKAARGEPNSVKVLQQPWVRAL